MRPKCLEPGCQNVAEMNVRTPTKDYYGKRCSTHKRLFYGMKNGYKKNQETWKRIRKNICSKCGWVGPCDAHRIIEGPQGGRYVKGNIMEICPNCHRLHHLGIKPITA